MNLSAAASWQRRRYTIHAINENGLYAMLLCYSSPGFGPETE
jgi:hypothetical protein